MTPSNIDIIIAHKPWRALDLSQHLENVTRSVLTYLQIPEPWSIAIKLTSDQDVQKLNDVFLGKNKPTNVLSFPAPEIPYPDEFTHLGDIILAYETIDQESRDQKKIFLEHVTHLLVHGILHLLGYDHVQETDAEEMEALEIQLLNQFNIKDPYQSHEQ